MASSDALTTPKPLSATASSTTTVQQPSQSQSLSHPHPNPQLQPRTQAMAPSTAQTGAKPNGPASFPQLSASTEEILKRMSANGGVQPGWEAAREQVLQRMKTSHNIQTPPPAQASGRGRGRGGRGSSASKGRSPGTASAANDVPASAPTTAPGRGRAGARGRGGSGRGGKRKRIKKEDDENDDDDEPSSSEELTPLPTKTKSGRRVHRPTHYDPATKTPTRRRGAYRRNANAEITTTCRTCGRGHSPTSNMIVFCDACNTPYHQFCHEPPIGEDIVKVEEKEWLCTLCRGGAGSRLAVEVVKPFSGESLSLDEMNRDTELAKKRAYISNLPRSTLVTLLLHATTLHPTLPISTTTSTDGTATSASALPLSALPNGPTPPSEPSPLQADLIEPDPDPSNPLAPIPKPGHGLRLPPESEDLDWLVDEDFTVFSHIYRDPTEGGMVKNMAEHDTLES
ncbi:MAG: hypothetical protein M4579_003257 [Chaenotheca gracillima]|nr:MAG: hypothetical protein M4579_003257 [Chaenotheca gracillima]